MPKLLRTKMIQQLHSRSTQK